jgi:H+/Cl- antiporter ClcA
VALRWATSFFLGLLAGYTPPAPAGEGATLGSGSHFVRPWVLPIVVGLGGLIAGIIVFGLAPEAEGHGTDAAISAVHHNPRGIRARVSVRQDRGLGDHNRVRGLGRARANGPDQRGIRLDAGTVARPDARRCEDRRHRGDRLWHRRHLPGAARRRDPGCGGLGPEDVEADALIPSLVASIMGFAVFGAVEGFGPIFGTLGGYHFNHPAELLYYALIGVAAGLVGRLYATTFYGVARLSRRLPGSRMLKPALGGLLVGLMAIAVPQVLGTGYGWVQVAMGAGILTLPLWIVLVLPLAKILATSLPIGTGGSGGVFGSGMVIGGFLGGAMWQLVHGLPAVPHSPAPFVVVGMIACFGSIAHAPLAVMLMVAEMTGNLEMLAPAMVTVGLASAFVGDETIYESQIRNRTESPAHRLRFGMPLLAALPVEEAMRPARLALEEDTPGRDAHEQLVGLGLADAPVVDARGTFRGSVDVERLGVPIARCVLGL